MADTATKAELTDFLDDDVRTFSPLFTPRGGYCRYTPPVPYSTEYDGSKTQTCFTPCPGVLGCAVPTPSYEQFVKWGQAAATYASVTNAQFALQATAIASGVAFGATVAAAGLAAFAGVAGTITATIAGTTFASVIWPFADALVTAAAGAAVIAVVVIVILAIIIAVMEGIRVTENAALPGKVAELVVNARTTVTDPATLIGTTDGAVTLYNLFVGRDHAAAAQRPRLRQLPDPALGLLHQLRPEPHRLRPPGQQHRDHQHARPQRLPQPAADPGGLRDPTRTSWSAPPARRRRWPRPSRSSTRPTEAARPSGCPATGSSPSAPT